MDFTFFMEFQWTMQEYCSKEKRYRCVHSNVLMPVVGSTESGMNGHFFRRYNSTSTRLFFTMSACLLFYISVGCDRIDKMDPPTIADSTIIKIPETYQTICYDNDTEISCPTLETEAFYGQDGCYNDYPDGRFEYDEGTDSLNRKQPIISDKITKVDWQGCAAPKEDNCDGSIRTFTSWEEADEYCENLIWGDKDDWQLPHRYPLDTILDLGTSNPAISSAFGTTLSNPPKKNKEFFWSATKCGPNLSGAWKIDFQYGEHDCASKTTPGLAVRCMRNVANVFEFKITDRFKVERKGAYDIIYDTVTNLMWQGECFDSTNGDDCANKDEADSKNLSWAEALHYCVNSNWGDYNDWRLPNRRELFSIVDIRINFKTLPGVKLWSSTTYNDNCGNVWTISLLDGRIVPESKIPDSADTKTEKNIRCVRNVEQQ